VETTFGIPDRLDVMFDVDKSIRPCRLVWHNDKQIGVEFETAHDVAAA